VVAVRFEPPPKKAACVPKGVVGPLSTPLARLVDLHLFALRPDEMEEIRLESDGRLLEVARSGTGWHLRAPTEGKVDHDVGQSFARMLHELSAEGVVTDKSPDALGLGGPKATAKITRAGVREDPVVETVELGSDVGDGFLYARRIADGAILRLTHDAAGELLPSPFALRSRKVIDEPVGQAARISIAGPSFRQVLRRSAGGTWILDEPKSLAVDPGLASDVAERLCGNKNFSLAGQVVPNGRADLVEGGYRVSGKYR